MSPLIAVRTDASIAIGTGHVVRTLTLGDELRVRGAEVIFITRSVAGDCNALIEGRGFRRLELASAGSELEDAAATGALLPGSVDAIVVDHYELGERWERALRERVRALLSIDDVAREHSCDLLLDQNVFPPDPSRYAGRLPAEATALLGPHYALLRPQFRRARAAAHAPRVGVLVFYSGSDEQDETSRALRGLARSRRGEDEVDVVIGASNPQRAAVETTARALLPHAQIHYDVEDMAALMVRRAWGLGASGTTGWERCCVGLAAVVTVLAPNQRPVAASLERAGAIRCIGAIDEVHETDYVAAIDGLEAPAIEQMRDAGLALVDGAGAGRVAESLLARLAYGH